MNKSYMYNLPKFALNAIGVSGYMQAIVTLLQINMSLIKVFHQES